MIKGLTVVKPVASVAAWERIAALFAELGFEPGRGWDDGMGRGAAFLAPVGNAEFVTGRLPGVPELLVEVTSLHRGARRGEAVAGGRGAVGGDDFSVDGG